MLSQAPRRLLRVMAYRSSASEGGLAAAGGLRWHSQAASPSDATFHAADTEYIRADTSKKPPSLEGVAFGRMFTDHMLVVDHSEALGWGRPRIVPLAPLPMHPASQVLHYGNCCFEGMKAYLGADGKGRLFRPDMNMARFLRSCQRLMLASFDGKEMLECLKALLRADRAWLPEQPGHSLYLRPFAFASEPALGVHRTANTTVAAIVCPVGPYFKTGFTAVDLYVDDLNVRAWPGGAGGFKIGGNYAPTVLPQQLAAEEHGCAQVVYTLPQGPDPRDALISECGSMNLLFVLAPERGGPGARPELVTPPLDGTILPGVTRDSILQLARGWEGVTVSERPLSVGELLRAHRSGRLLEVFGSGTACVVQPVKGMVLATGEVLQLPWDPANDTTLAARLGKALTDIQHGRVRHEWSVPFE